jgi:hypothetical protein
MTAEISESLGALVIRHQRNMGKGAAMQTLFQAARQMDAQVLITLDADGQHSPNDIPKLVEPILTDSADIVIGSRFLPGFQHNTRMPFYRRVGNFILNRFTTVSSPKPRKKKRYNIRGSDSRNKYDRPINGISDTQSGFRAYSKRAISTIAVSDTSIGVDSQILMDAISKDLRVIETPIVVSYEGDTSTYNPVRHTATVALSVIEYVTQKRPLAILGIPGIALLTVGSVLLVEVANIFISKHVLLIADGVVAGAFAITGIIAIVSSVILHALGDVKDRIDYIEKLSAKVNASINDYYDNGNNDNNARSRHRWNRKRGEEGNDLFNEDISGGTT